MYPVTTLSFLLSNLKDFIKLHAQICVDVHTMYKNVICMTIMQRSEEVVKLLRAKI